MEQSHLEFSLIIPVYNRPDEIKELLQSIAGQTDKEFEVVIIEDGSQIPCETIVNIFSQQLNIHYFSKENSGPGLSRNFGCDRANGNYYIFLDSDCILHPGYIQIVKSSLNVNYVDAFGGPDRSHESFTIFQKAVSYSMTSLLTTGGIRGGGEKLDKFFPRSFNMGFSKEVYLKTNGFSKMRFGEDIDLSLRIIENGFITKLIKDAYVYHKRRNTIKQFFKQVYNSGIARINLYKKHPGSLKLVHTFPALFTIGVLLCLLSFLFFGVIFLFPIVFYALLVFFHSMISHRSLSIGLYSVAASYIQLIGYGLGFLYSFWERIVLHNDEFSAFNKNFYK